MNSGQDYATGDEPDTREDQWAWTDWVKGRKKKWHPAKEKFWRVPKEIKCHRYVTCLKCEEFIPLTTQCKRCWCAMGVKTWYAGFRCPKGKWPAVSPPRDADGS